MRNLVREPTTYDMVYVAMHMNKDDRNEVIAATGDQDMLRVINDSVTRSAMCWAFQPADEPVCLFGVVPLSMLGAGSPWLLSTGRILEYPRPLLKGGRACVAHMLAEFPYLVNYVDARHVRSLRWLARLGFTVYDPLPYGAAGLPFHKVELCARR